jgi:hypothetical protein
MIYSMGSFENESGKLLGFSPEGLANLFSFLESKLGRHVEIDIFTICHHFAEYANATSAARYCGWTGCALDTNQQEAQALEWLKAQTIVITFDNGLIIFKPETNATSNTQRTIGQHTLGV